MDEKKRVSSGPVLINRIRLALVILYTLSIAGSFNTNTPAQNLAYVLATALMLLYGIGFFFWNRFGTVPAYLPRILLILDTTILILVIAAGVVDRPDVAKGALTSTALYTIFLYYIISSAFIASTRFVIIMGIYSGIGSACTSLLAMRSGLVYTADPALANLPDHLAGSTEIIKVLFILGVAAIVRLVIRVIVQNEGAEKALEDARQNFDAVQAKQTAMKNSAEQLRFLTTKIELLTNSFNEQFQSQAASLEEISAAMEQLSASSENSLDTVRQQYERLDGMNRESDQLEAGFNKVIASTHSLKISMDGARANSGEVTGTVTEARSSFQQIQDSFQRVNDVNQIMADIADKTNLLALNASIEAARAGEHGRGFSVVAEEVSRLADNSSRNARTISQIIGESGSLIQKGGQVTDRAIAMVEQQQQEFASIAVSFQDLTKLVQAQRDINQKFLAVLKELRNFSADLERTAVEQKEGTVNIASALSELDGAITGLVSRASELAAHHSTLEDQARLLEES